MLWCAERKRAALQFARDLANGPDGATISAQAESPPENGRKEVGMRVPAKPKGSRSITDRWEKSSFSQGVSNCVGARLCTCHQGGVEMADTQNMALGALHLYRQDWVAMVGALKRGEFA